MWTNVPSDRLRRALAVSLTALLCVLAPVVARADEPAIDPPPEGPPPAADPLDALRGRLREGMEKYRARAFADAIVIWESIYRELGPQKGYRVAFDLGRAYDELGELIKAAEHYQTYLDRVAARRLDGESLEPNVQLQETIARDRLERIIHIYGAIRVAHTKRPMIVHVDNAPGRVAGFVVYVEPGVHTLTFGTGSKDIRNVTVRRGELLEITPPEEAPAGAVLYEARVEHPFSPVVLWVGAGAAVVSLVIPLITYTNALSIKSDYDATANATQSQELRDKRALLQSDYESAVSNAYASVVVPAVFTAAAGGLALWYVLGRKETRIPIPTATISSTGASAGLSTSF
jgi:hypothetical protein